MMRERDLQTYELDIVRCIYCGDCVEVCPHGALGETPNFESRRTSASTTTVLAKEELAVARTWKPSEQIPHNAMQGRRASAEFVRRHRPAGARDPWDRLVARIRARGPLSFADYMEAALYDPDEGYYTAAPRWASRVTTSRHPHLGTHFGVRSAGAFADCWAAPSASPRPGSGRGGSGRGTLLRDVLVALERERPDATRGVRPRIVEDRRFA